MRLYLSSFRLGVAAARLRPLAGGPRAVVLAHALDANGRDARRSGAAAEIAALEGLGFRAREADLYESGPEALADADLVWVRGGNAFVLRRALADTGSDLAIRQLLAEDAIAYGGYSAGCCVLAPDLTGLEGVDDPAPAGEVTWAGLGVLDRPFVPHVDSPSHPETEQCDGVAARHRAAGRPHWALRDGEVLIVAGDTVELVKP